MFVLYHNDNCFLDLSFIPGICFLFFACLSLSMAYGCFGVDKKNVNVFFLKQILVY